MTQKQVAQKGVKKIIFNKEINKKFIESYPDKIVSEFNNFC